MNAAARAALTQAVEELPLRFAEPISIGVRPDLTAWRGKLLSRSDRGRPVHAATYIRERRVVLETALEADSTRFVFIAVHELFHFVWARLFHRTRASFAELLRIEDDKSGRGELGESSDVAKRLWRATRSHSAWKNYSAESFCDSAAVFCVHPCEFEGEKLAKRWRERRRSWFAKTQPPNGWLC